MKKKVISSILSLVMLLSLLPVSAFAVPAAGGSGGGGGTATPVQNPIKVTFEKYTFTTGQTTIYVPINDDPTAITGLDQGTKVYVGGDEWGTVGADGTLTAKANAEKAAASLTGAANKDVTFKTGTSDSETTVLTLKVIDPVSIKCDNTGAATVDGTSKTIGSTGIANKAYYSGFASAMTGTATIQLTQDITSTACLTVHPGETVTLDMNGKTLTSSHNPYTVRVYGEGTNGTATANKSGVLTITGAGSLMNTTTGSTVVCCDWYGTVNVGAKTDGSDITRFRIARDVDGNDAVGHSAIKGDEWSTINIYGGTFNGTDKSSSYNSVQSYGTVTISGGTLDLLRK